VASTAEEDAATSACTNSGTGCRLALVTQAHIRRADTGNRLWHRLPAPTRIQYSCFSQMQPWSDSEKQHYRPGAPGHVWEHLVAWGRLGFSCLLFFGRNLIPPSSHGDRRLPIPSLNCSSSSSSSSSSMARIIAAPRRAVPHRRTSTPVAGRRKCLCHSLSLFFWFWVCWVFYFH